MKMSFEPDHFIELRKELKYRNGDLLPKGARGVIIKLSVHGHLVQFHPEHMCKLNHDVLESEMVDTGVVADWNDKETYIEWHPIHDMYDYYAYGIMHTMHDKTGRWIPLWGDAMIIEQIQNEVLRLVLGELQGIVAELEENKYISAYMRLKKITNNITKEFNIRDVKVGKWKDE